MSQATQVKLCQLFLQTTSNMTHQSINYIKYGLSVHTGQRHLKAL